MNKCEKELSKVHLDIIITIELWQRRQKGISKYGKNPDFQFVFDALNDLTKLALSDLESILIKSGISKKVIEETIEMIQQESS